MRSSQFVEAYVCRLLGGRQTAHSHKVDCLCDEVRIEIKHAIAFDAEIDSGIRRRLCFRYLQGSKGQGKDADVYVMVGYDEDKFYYLVIPALRLGRRRDLDFFLFNTDGRESRKWAPYLVPEENLKEAVERAALNPKSYKGWSRPDLFA